MLKSELLAALSEGEAKAVECNMLELQLSKLKEQLLCSNELLQESIPRSEYLSFQTNIILNFEEFKEFVSSFRQEAKLLIADSVSKIDEMLDDPDICVPVLEVVQKGRNQGHSLLGSAPPVTNDELIASNQHDDENALSEVNFEELCVVHHSRNLGYSKLGSAPPPSSDGLNSSVNQYEENSMSEENLDISSNISTGESVTLSFPSE